MYVSLSAYNARVKHSGTSVLFAEISIASWIWPHKDLWMSLAATGLNYSTSLGPVAQGLIAYRVDNYNFIDMFFQ